MCSVFWVIQKHKLEHFGLQTSACLPDAESRAALLLTCQSTAHVLKTVSAAAAAAVHKPQQRADRDQDMLQATQMHTLFHKNKWQARVGRIALWLQPKCCLC